jgi:hypothetical protein
VSDYVTYLEFKPRNTFDRGFESFIP